jgi:uncharacterized membrane protein
MIQILFLLNISSQVRAKLYGNLMPMFVDGFPKVWIVKEENRQENLVTTFMVKAKFKN